ncbi:MAG: AI-2E family transporter [Alphaproteobacteria bacterium]
MSSLTDIEDVILKSSELNEKTSFDPLVKPPEKRPLDTLVFFAGALVVMAMLSLCYVAGEVILPVCVALFLNLLFRPVLRFLHKFRIPRTIAAALIIIALLGGMVVLGKALSGPVAEWGEKLPTALPKLQERIHFLMRPVATIQKTVNAAENVTIAKDVVTPKDTKVLPVAIALPTPKLSDRLFTSTRVVLGGIFVTFLVLFFLLLSGDTFLHRFIEILPRIQDKKKTFEISNQVERNISAYLMTITIINFFVGCATALIMHLCGVGDAILWGTVAFFLNYVPVLGPITAACIFVVAGMLANASVPMAFLPAGLYFLIHLLEGEVITPLIVSKRFTLNPTLVILMLIFWYWMWGVAGAILATPMLAIFKIICDHTTRLKPIGHLIEG